MLLLQSRLEETMNQGKEQLIQILQKLLKITSNFVINAFLKGLNDQKQSNLL